MVKITVLGSCAWEPYEILAVPNKIPGAWNTDEGYKIAFETVFKEAIENCDFVFVYNPTGVGTHTQMDIDYAKKQGKQVIYFDPIQAKSPWDSEFKEKDENE